MIHLKALKYDGLVQFVTSMHSHAFTDKSVSVEIIGRGQKKAYTSK